MIVLDASALLELLLRGDGAPEIEEHLDRSDVLCAPHLLDLEVTQALDGYCASGELQPSRAREALQDLQDLGIVRYPHASLVHRIWELRREYTTFEATYLALAESLSAPLLTCDDKLKSASESSLRLEVMWIGRP